jgi:hypothetical protein
MRQATRAGVGGQAGSDPTAIHSGDSAAGADVAGGSTYPSGIVIASGAITLAKLANLSAQGKLIGRKTAAAGVPEEVALGSSLTFPAGGNIDVATGGVTLAMLANLTPPKLIGRGTAAAGVPEALTPTNLYFGNGTVGAAPSRTAAWTGGAFLMSNLDLPGTNMSGNTTKTLTVATVYLMKVPIPGSGTSTFVVSNVSAYLTTKATSTLTHSYYGIISSGGTLLGQSADLSSGANRWDTSGANGWNTAPCAATITPTGLNDFVYVCMYVGTSVGTAPIFQGFSTATSPTAFMNLNMAAAASMHATQAVADSATPFTGLTLSNNVASVTSPILVALS